MNTVLFIALLVGADARVAPALKSLISEPNFQEEAKFCHQKIDEMLTDPTSLVKAKHVAEQLKALMASPTVQEQVNTFAERVDVDFQNQMKSVTQKMEMMQAGDPNFQVQAKHLQEQMKEILAKSVTDQMGALSADPGFQEQAKLFAEGMQNSNDKMVDKMLDRGLKTSSFEHANLENAVLGKPSSIAAQPRSGIQSTIFRATQRSNRAPSILAASPKAPPPPLKEKAGPFDWLGTALENMDYGGVTPKNDRNVGTRGTYEYKRVAQSKKPRAFSTISSRTFARGKDQFPRRKTVSGRAAVATTVEEPLFDPLAIATAEVSDEVQDTIQDAGVLFARLAVASVMIHHGQEKILSAEAFTKFAIDKYFSFLPPIGDSRVIWAYGAGAAQFAGPILVSLGVFSRLANVAMAGTMIGATYYSIITTGLEGFPLSKMAARVPIFHNYGFEAPVLYFAIFAVCAALGPGKISVAQALGWNDDKSLLGKLKQ